MENFHCSNFEKSKNLKIINSYALLMCEMAERGSLSRCSLSTDFALHKVLHSINGSIEAKIAQTSHSTVYCVKSGLSVVFHILN